MTMSLLPDEGFESFYMADIAFSASEGDVSPAGRAVRSTLPLVQGKLRVPEVKPGVVPDRLISMLDRSVQSRSGTLIVGRAGAGKTTLAAEYSSRASSRAWYTIDAADADWAAFSRYFRAAILGKRANERARPSSEPRSPLELFADLTAALELRSLNWPSLLVLDGVHYLFDSNWFAEFFQMMIASIPPPAHVLILSRSKPTNPIWRLRSKQMLGVIDERVLSFSPVEAEELFAGSGLDRSEGARAHRESYGQAGKLIDILEAKVRAARSR